MDGLALLSGAKRRGGVGGGVRADLSSHPARLIQFLAFLPQPPPTLSQPTVIKVSPVAQQGFPARPLSGWSLVPPPARCCLALV